MAAVTTKLERQQKASAQRLHRARTEDRPPDQNAGRKNPDPIGSLLCNYDSEVAGPRATIADLNRCLARETARRERLEESQQADEDARSTHRRAEQEHDAPRNELAVVEGIESVPPRLPADPAGRLQLAGSTILYIGGRPHQVPPPKALVELADGQFIDHHGGVEHTAELLPGVISHGRNGPHLALLSVASSR